MTGTPEKLVVLVTGSSGLIGSRLVERLSETWHVIGFDLKPPPRLPPGAAFVACDLTSDESVAHAVAEVLGSAGRKIASVVHLAAYYDFSGRPSPLYERLTVEGTRRLLAALRPLDVEQFVFSSTLLVHKPADEEGEVLTESSEIEPAWDYPHSKVAAEEVIRSERGRVPAVVLRIAGAYDDSGHSIPLAQHIRRIREKQLESYFFPGDPGHGQPFVHLDDLLECIGRVLEKRGALGPYEVFLVAEPEVMTHEALQEQLGMLLHGREWPTIRIPEALAKAGAWVRGKLAGKEETFIKPWMVALADDHYPVAIDHARLLLGWEPRRRLRETLPAIVAALERDPPGWYREHDLPWTGPRVD